MGLKGVARFLTKITNSARCQLRPIALGFSVLLWHSPFMLTGDGSFTMRPYLWV